MRERALDATSIVMVGLCIVFRLVDWYGYYADLNVLGLASVILLVAGIVFIAFVEDDRFLTVFGAAGLTMMAVLTVPYAFAYHAHDYMVYSEELRSPGVTDLPVSWIAMKVMVLVFGNPEGLMLLDLLLALSVTAIFMARNRDKRFLFALIPFLVLGNRGMKYMVGGLVRNMIALAVLCFALNTRKVREGYMIVVLGLTHTLTLAYYVLCRILRGENLREVVATTAIVFAASLVLGCAISDRVLTSVLKPLTHLIWLSDPCCLRLPLYEFWNNYQLSVLSVIPVSLKYWREDKAYVWLVVLLIPFLPHIKLNQYKMMLRLIYMSWLPLMMLVSQFKLTLSERVYLSLLASYSTLTKLL